MHLGPEKCFWVLKSAELAEVSGASGRMFVFWLSVCVRGAWIIEESLPNGKAAEAFVRRTTVNMVVAMFNDSCM